MATFNCLGTGSKGNCYIVRTGGCTFLLDAGVSLEKITSAVNLNDVRFALITHEHKDHADCMRNLCLRGVPVAYGKLYTGFREIESKVKRTRLYAFPVVHDAPCCGFIIENDKDCILYITDFKVCKWNLKSFKFTHILVECNYMESAVQYDKMDFKLIRQINTHMGFTGLQIFLDSLDRSKLKEIIICHKSTTEWLFDETIVTSILNTKYNVPIGCCQHYGGINWTGKGIDKNE